MKRVAEVLFNTIAFAAFVGMFIALCFYTAAFIAELIGAN